jgi:hypothetical protein
MSQKHIWLYLHNQSGITDLLKTVVANIKNCESNVDKSLPIHFRFILKGLKPSGSPEYTHRTLDISASYDFILQSSRVVLDNFVARLIARMVPTPGLVEVVLACIAGVEIWMPEAQKTNAVWNTKAFDVFKADWLKDWCSTSYGRY